MKPIKIIQIFALHRINVLELSAPAPVVQNIIMAMEGDGELEPVTQNWLRRELPEVMIDVDKAAQY